MEVNNVAEQCDLDTNTEFNRGYRAGMMVIMKAIQDEINAFESINSQISLGLIDVDAWFACK
jgi:hypothetical protein